MRLSLFSFALVALSTQTQAYLPCVNASTPLNKGDCHSWQDFWQSTNGSGWKWCRDVPRSNPCACVFKAQGLKIGVQCSEGNRSIVGINMFQNNLAGTLADSFGEMTSLLSMQLTANTISGTLPDSIGQMTKVTSLQIDNNEFEGKIPHTLGSLAQLTTLAVFNNKLTGTIPEGIYRLSNLINLNLDGNELSGSLSSEIASLSSVIDMTLDHNNFTGPIPAALDKLPHLEGLQVSNNAFTGVLPQLHFAHFDNFCDFSMNNFTCPLPLGAKAKCNAACT